MFISLLLPSSSCQALLLFCGNPSFKVATFRRCLSLMKGIGNAPDYLGYTTVHALLQAASPCSEHLEGLRHIVSGVSGVSGERSEEPSFYQINEGTVDMRSLMIGAMGDILPLLIYVSLSPSSFFLLFSGAMGDILTRLHGELQGVRGGRGSMRSRR